MATDADEPTAAPEAASNADSIASSSDSDSDSGEASGKSVEWLATGREKRSTAGNRMKSLLATATPADEDSDLELLFQEDEDDVGFTDKEDDDGSDAAMESTDDEDENEAHEDDAGEKELERQAKEKRAAARKRKAQEAIPAKFRKKVRIQPPDASGAGTAAAPPPRPKKKSERASWLPTEAEMPTRASGRKTTQLSKEQLHLQMIDREAKRLKQVELMERQAKRKEAMKKPPMTQAERLREAAIVEKRNAKSLNRWEEAEKQREEERRAKLAALNNRRLEGPVVTFWTGIIDLSEVQLKHVGKMVTMEEKPKRKRPATAAGKETASSAVLGTEDGPPETADATAITQSAPGLSSRPETPREPETPKVEPTTAVPVDTTPSTFMPSIHRPSVPLGPSNVPLRPAAEAPRLPPVPFQPTPSPTFRPITPAVTFGAPMPPTPTGPQNPFKLNANAAFAPPIPSPMVKTEPPSSKPMPLALRPDIGPRFMPPPNPHFALPAPPTQLLPSVGASSGQMPAVAARSAIPIAPVASLSALGPGPGLRPGPPPPLVPSLTQALSISPPPTNPNALTAFPSPHQIPTPQPPPGHTTASFQPIFPTSPPVDVAKKQQIEQAVPKKSNGKASAARKASIVPEPPVPEPPMEGKVTRACIILQDFDEDAIKKPDVQTQILFGWKMNRLASKFMMYTQRSFRQELTRIIQNHLILHFASSPINRLATETPRPACHTTTLMPSRKFRSLPRAISNGASYLAHGLAMLPKPPTAFQTDSFIRRQKSNERKDLSARNKIRKWPRSRGMLPRQQKLQRHLQSRRKSRLLRLCLMPTSRCPMQPPRRLQVLSQLRFPPLRFRTWFHLCRWVRRR